MEIVITRKSGMLSTPNNNQFILEVKSENNRIKGIAFLEHHKNVFVEWDEPITHANLVSRAKEIESALEFNLKNAVMGL